MFSLARGVMRLGPFIAGSLLIAGFGAPASPDLPPPPPHANGQALWRIVHGKCVPDQEAAGQPAPCVKVDLSGGEAKGYAVLKDLHGAEQYLVMPTLDITGIEDSRLLEPGDPNWFADAWGAKPFVDARIGRTTPREWMAVSVNSLYGRSQDLLHLHVDCLTPAARKAIDALAPSLGRSWSAKPFEIVGHRYLAMRLDGEAPAADPFLLLAKGVPGARAQMGAWTLVMAGVEVRGRPGFVLLAGRADPLHGEFASGEVLQDHDCALAHGA
jgi:CDP-diacylglycerol pyrophosphatase